MSEKETTKLYNGITGIDNDIIEGAQNSIPHRKAKSPVWVKWGAMAACFCLLLLGAFTIPTMIDNSSNVTLPNTSDEIAYGFTMQDSDVIYFPISFEQRKIYGLVDEDATGLTNENTYQITSDDLGKVAGVVGDSEDERLVGATAYYFVNFPNDSSICILEINGVYQFYVEDGLHRSDITPNTNSNIDAPVDEDNYQDAEPNAPVEYGTGHYDILPNSSVDAPVDESNYQDADPNAAAEYGTAVYDILPNSSVDAPVDEGNYQNADPNAPVEYGSADYDILIHQ